MGSSCQRCSPLASKIRKDAFAIQLFCLILIQASLADEAGRLQEFSSLAKSIVVRTIHPYKHGFKEYERSLTTKVIEMGCVQGPGCSSLGGAMLEIGPFFVNRDNKTLSRNKYAWNNVANMLFLESPAGVGFSHSNRTSDYNNTGDRSTAADAYTFLINWLERFPEYKGRSFFITAESYGGHYIPQLANTILSNNKIMNTTMINLKGVAKLTKQFRICSFNRTYTGLCRTAIEEANNEKGLIDQSNIYASFCWDASAPQQQHASVTNIDPCASYYMRSYLNRQEVQRAFHANTTGLKQPWSDCSSICFLSTSHIISPENWKDAQVSMLPSIEHLISSGVSIWLYSGDIDAVCPVISTLYSLDILGLQINSSWRAWYSDDDEIQTSYSL
ncbi:serine carboxypeptidase II-3-like [Panicum miliaceum]|uniref:Carboxypeptidase n=1 Tax=Panicum miliaceum TaxID=4540 RepID=A0A3L6TQR8_PANMI|nr:serine carboxypeptidase II-3-like [Panicum miliaceum]